MSDTSFSPKLATPRVYPFNLRWETVSSTHFRDQDLARRGRAGRPPPTNSYKWRRVMMIAPKLSQLTLLGCTQLNEGLRKDLGGWNGLKGDSSRNWIVCATEIWFWQLSSLPLALWGLLSRWAMLKVVYMSNAGLDDCQITLNLRSYVCHISLV